jgi:ATP/maltotriose-dependent transcriptional regulator MalT
VPAESSDSEETKLLREEVALQRAEKEERERIEELKEELKNRVSVAAIILTTALSFISNVKGDRADAAASAKGAASDARRQGAELWAYYQTKLAERTSLELARDRVRLELARRGLSREDPEVRMDAFKLTGYEERIRDFDTETERVFYRVQDLERQEDVSQRAAAEPGLAVTRYELGGKLITLALILLSVTILSSKRYLLWAGVTLGSIGLLVALDGYFLFL